MNAVLVTKPGTPERELVESVKNDLRLNGLQIKIFIKHFREYLKVPKSALADQDTYSTDGMIVRNQNGDCMGIFSTVSLLNDKIAENEKLRFMIDQGLGWEDLKNEI